MRRIIVIFLDFKYNIKYTGIYLGPTRVFYVSLFFFVV